MNRADYYGLRHWYRAERRRLANPTARLRATHQDVAMLEDAFLRLGGWQGSDFGRWLAACADRRNRTLELVRARKRREAADAREAAIDFTGMTQAQRIEAIFDARWPKAAA